VPEGRTPGLASVIRAEHRLAPIGFEN
jgi:hypothetical protein